MIKSIDKIAIIGFGYLSLPLAIKFAKKHNLVDFDINTHHIAELTKTYVDGRL